MGCRIENCPGEAVIGGLCRKHYMRQRRTGNPAVRGKPGPKSGPRPIVLSAAEASALVALRHEVITLRRQLAQARAAADASELATLRQKVSALEQESVRLGTERIMLRRQLAQVQAKAHAAAKPPRPPRPRPETE